MKSFFIEATSRRLISRSGGVTPKITILCEKSFKLSFQVFECGNLVTFKEGDSFSLNGAIDWYGQGVLFESHLVVDADTTDTLVFEVDSYTQEYIDAIQNIDREIFFQLWETTNKPIGGRIYLQATAIAQPRTDNGDEPPSGIARRAVVSAYPLPRYYDENLGGCVIADSLTSTIAFDADGVYQADLLELEMRSVSNITGNVVFELSIDGEFVSREVILVSANWKSHAIQPLSPLSGYLTLKRLYNDPEDTLQDDGAVAVALRLFSYRRVMR